MLVTIVRANSEYEKGDEVQLEIFEALKLIKRGVAEPVIEEGRKINGRRTCRYIDRQTH